MHQITEVEKAYLAGMIDADGNISIVPHKNGRTTAIRVGVTNTYAPLIELLMDWTGGTFSYKRSPCSLDCSKQHVHSRKQSYRFILIGDRAVVVLQNILPYMMEKRELAAKAIFEGLASRSRSRVKRESPGVKELREKGWHVPSL